MSEPFEHMVAVGDPLAYEWVLNPAWVKAECQLDPATGQIFKRDIGDIECHPNCSNCLARIFIHLDKPREIFLSDFLNLEIQVNSAYWKAIDEKLKQQLRILHDGELPSPKEFAKNAKRVTFPDGRVEYYWGTTLILSEKPLFEHLDKT